MTLIKVTIKNGNGDVLHIEKIDLIPGVNNNTTSLNVNGKLEATIIVEAVLPERL